ncbi:histidine phosphatase superfamily [Pyrenochaeta sp. MPI-SDFR-AT-0127]|nr:histidine phosphatase superfamily [Pyrenochaeta sp. MPI-SDFR-AT-0127]
MSLKIIIASTTLLAWAQAETILGVTVFTRHGDRTSKHYKGYNLTNLGFQQNYNVGASYRDIYISSDSDKQIHGISENKAVNSQIYASAPDQAVLLNTATAFLQGLYPPLQNLGSDGGVQTLNNGEQVMTPLEGYQYLVLHGENSDSPDTVWLKGDEECPPATTSIKNFKSSEIFKQREQETKDFYASFWDAMRGVYDYQESNMSYANAYDIFDLLNVARIHNSSLANATSTEDLARLRTLADSAEFGSSYDAEDKARSIGGQAFAGGILAQLASIVSSKGKLKFSLLAGSYDTFQSFFGLSNLTSVSPDFFGLPEYASTMAFEIFTSENVTSFPSTSDDLRVRFLFRNGSITGESPRVFPLFGGQDTSLPYGEFVSKMQKFAITSPEQWCGICKSELLFCEAYSARDASTEQTAERNGTGMSNTVAGVIGAMVTLGVVAIIGAVAFFMWRKRGRAASPVPVSNKMSARSGSESDSV